MGSLADEPTGEIVKRVILRDPQLPLHVRKFVNDTKATVTAVRYTGNIVIINIHMVTFIDTF
jgi:hypothetical protein